MTLAAGVAVLRSTGYELHPEVSARLRSMTAWQYVVMQAVGRRILDPERTDVAGFADDYLDGLPETDRTELFKLLALIEHIAPVGHGYARRFTDLYDTEQDHVLESLEQSQISALRAGFEALKAICMMAYYRLPESWGPLGYRGPVSPRSLP